jgi:Zn-dependent protease
MTDANVTAVDFDDAFYRQVRDRVLNPRTKISGLIYLAFFLMFIWSQFEGIESLQSIAVVVAVVFLHEVGHLAGMKLFGFRDVRMLFIPFLGAAVSGRARGAAGWKDALVSLAGPGPGIALGLIGFFVLQRYPLPLVFAAVQMLLFINTFNLLPFGALDGGRFMQRVLFSRHRVLEVGFIAIGSGLLGLLALLGQMYALAVFALLGLLLVPSRWRVLGAAGRLRRELADVDPDPDKLDDVQGKAVFSAACAILNGPASNNASQVAATMESILDALRRPPGVLASMALLTLYGATWLFALFGVVFVALTSGEPNWRAIDRGAVRAEFPGEPRIWPLRERTPVGERDGEVARVVVKGIERYALTVVDAGEPVEANLWIDLERDRIAADSSLQVASDDPVTVSGIAGREIIFRNSWRALQARLFVDGTHLYEITTSAPRLGYNAKQFVDSLSIEPGRQPGAMPASGPAAAAASLPAAAVTAPSSAP